MSYGCSVFIERKKSNDEGKRKKNVTPYNVSMIFSSSSFLSKFVFGILLGIPWWKKTKSLLYSLDAIVAWSIRFWKSLQTSLQFQSVLSTALHSDGKNGLFCLLPFFENDVYVWRTGLAKYITIVMKVNPVLYFARNYCCCCCCCYLESFKEFQNFGKMAQM